MINIILDIFCIIGLLSLFFGAICIDILIGYMTISLIRDWRKERQNKNERTISRR